MLSENDIIEAISEGSAVPKKQVFGSEDARSALEEVGFKVLGDFEGELLYFATELPEGWQMRFDNGFGRTCGSTVRLWVKWTLTDDKERKRGELAWFYNPNSDESWVAVYPRFGCHVDGDSRPGYCCGCVVDRAEKQKIIFCTDYIPGPAPIKDDGKTLTINCSKESARLLRELNGAAEKWLDDNYPGWRSPAAYWD